MVKQKLGLSHDDANPTYTGIERDYKGNGVFEVTAQRDGVNVHYTARVNESRFSLFFKNLFGIEPRLADLELTLIGEEELKK
ncbi:hypothetical protein COV11_03070 [Candidatus Woesearchaeota archaeon CG10_big_fil_rev_8_21_14_0_10_30_7]|nr:MAG: hypothetical protein COV11_03070 [Candidatus Woesearchaeota archaeon CG10_big_fil_rev_8_21_14_0_10_30_7]